ncbi:hypothetical protein CKO09_10665 [Chromatium weissei]|nr:hypothetical protein [Chromatium weissei]
MQHVSSNSATATVYRTLKTFANAMQNAATPRDGMLSARVIGEFSAGKTRLLRELLGELIPPPLFPLSSLECQTRLPLEITFAPTAELNLIQRANDYDSAKSIKKLTQFPMREELDKKYNPLHYRLQLTVPDSHLFLPNGDGYEEGNEPKRLLLIDMPGWNSGDDASAEGSANELMTGDHNLALVFVVNANRIDGAANTKRLRDFLDAFQNADFVGQETLLMVITHCPQPDQQRLKERLRERVLNMWRDELDGDEEKLKLHLLAVDFAELSANELAQFRTTFWSYLLEPLEETCGKPVTVAHPWQMQFNRWPTDWDVRSRLIQTHNLLNHANDLLARACINDEFLPGMNMHRLMGLNAMDIQKKLRDRWFRQLKCQHQQELMSSLSAPASLKLPSGHPLTDWWRDYWLKQLEQALTLAREFFQKADAVFNQVRPNTPDLQEHFSASLNGKHLLAMQGLDSSFICLVNTAQSIAAESQLYKITATLLNLSLLEARCADHYRRADGR